MLTGTVDFVFIRKNVGFIIKLHIFWTLSVLENNAQLQFLVDPLYWLAYQPIRMGCTDYIKVWIILIHSKISKVCRKFWRRMELEQVRKKKYSFILWNESLTTGNQILLFIVYRVYKLSWINYSRISKVCRKFLRKME